MLPTSRSRCVLRLLVNSVFVGIATGQDKFSFDFDRIESCAAFDNVDVDLSGISVDMSDTGDIELKGSFAFNIDIGQGPWGIAAELYRDTGQQYISIFSDTLDDFCQELGRADAPWSEPLRMLSPKPPSECPVKAGTYGVAGLRADTDALEYKQQLEGGYKLNVKMTLPPAPGAPPSPFLCYDIFFILGAQ